MEALRLQGISASGSKNYRTPHRSYQYLQFLPELDSPVYLRDNGPAHQISILILRRADRPHRPGFRGRCSLAWDSYNEYRVPLVKFEPVPTTSPVGNVLLNSSDACHSWAAYLETQFLRDFPNDS